MQGTIEINAYKDTGVEVKAAITCESYSDVVSIRDIINALLDNKKEGKE